MSPKIEISNLNVLVFGNSAFSQTKKGAKKGFWGLGDIDSSHCVIWRHSSTWFGPPPSHVGFLINCQCGMAHCYVQRLKTKETGKQNKTEKTVIHN